MRRDLYRTSTAVLRAHEGKTVPGAVIASLSIPWGQARGTRTWAGAAITWSGPATWPRSPAASWRRVPATTPGAILEYLAATQEADGHWPQNMWVGGETYWSSIQLGETALPVLLVDLLHREGVVTDERARADSGPWSAGRSSTSLHHGPSSQEDRWENERGFTPFTLAAMIAALLVAAELAERAGRYGRRRVPAGDGRCLERRHRALDLRRGDRRWPAASASTATICGSPRPMIGGSRSSTAGHLEFWYRPSTRDQFAPADIVSPDALAYVRFGLRAPDDPRIVNTIKVIDATLKVETPYGPCWHRYSHDGYGEKADGSPFDGEHGYGRAWPLLTGERAHYELAAGRPAEAMRLLRAMERFAGDGGLIPEQVWDTA